LVERELGALLELSEETGLMPGTAYPILLRLEHEGWVTSRWEDVDPPGGERPARRYYRLTAGGAALTGWADEAAGTGAASRTSGIAPRASDGQSRQASAQAGLQPCVLNLPPTSPSSWDGRGGIRTT
jgi:hypothetical protein